MTWYMGGMEGGAYHARPRVIRGTRAKPLPLLPSGPGGVYDRPLHEARSLTTSNGNIQRYFCDSSTACNFSPKGVAAGAGFRSAGTGTAGWLRRWRLADAGKLFLQKHALERRNPIREFALDLAVPFQCAAQRVHLGIEIVEMMQQESFGEHGRLRRSKFEFAVMA